MSDVIIIRLTPQKPTDGASFSSYLKDLTISVSDLSFDEPRGKDTSGADNTIGKAFYDPADANSTIIQHEMPFPSPPGMLAAVATAAIVIDPAKEPPTYAEYVTSDLRLTIKRGTQTLVDQSLNYNVQVDPGAGPALSSQDPAVYAGFGPVALYLSLPTAAIGLDPNRAYISLPKDGSPPNFKDLYNNVNKVLTQDPGAGQFDLAALTAVQCTHIAYEILGNRDINPLPSPPNTLEDLYTQPNASSFDNDRNKFEADLITFYSTNNSQAQVLAKYIFALSTALACSKMTDAATQANFEFPVLPGTGGGIGKIGVTDVILS